MFSGTANATSLKQRIVAQVHETHRLQSQLRQPRTRYAGRVNPYVLRQWRAHHGLWWRRNRDPHWVSKAVWPRGTWVTLFCVISRESGWNPRADNPYSTATGLLQILGGPKTVWGNLELGYRMYRARRWTPWYGAGSCGLP